MVVEFAVAEEAGPVVVVEFVVLAPEWIEVVVGFVAELVAVLVEVLVELLVLVEFVQVWQHEPVALQVFYEFVNQVLKGS